MVPHSWPPWTACIVFLLTVLLSVTHQSHLRNYLSFLGSPWVTFLCGLFVIPISKILCGRMLRISDGSSTAASVYGLDHGRLHVRLPLPMWMNMGYWDNRACHHDASKPIARHSNRTLATASRALLSEVLKTAGLNQNGQAVQIFDGPVENRCLIDLGFGCGDQTMYLMGPRAILEPDEPWWDYKSDNSCFDSYTGLTLNMKQFQYAQERVRELQNDPGAFKGSKKHQDRIHNIKLFCADAARPDRWSEELNRHLLTVIRVANDPWVLALDTLYHFSPSRWPIVAYAANTLKASLMAFDLHLADEVSRRDLFILRSLTSLMGAPWANFVTQDQYRKKLLEAGYRDIAIRDISEQVFEPLSEFLGEQHRALQIIGHGLGPFHAARWMFGWWARTGIVRAVIVVAKH